MKRFTLSLLALLLCLPMAMRADNEINLTPVPMKMTKGTGTLTLPQSFTIATGNIGEENAAEAEKFAALFSGVTGYTVEVKEEASDALITMGMYNGSEELGIEGYTLDITADGISVTANSANGFFYAFQTLKQLMPRNASGKRHGRSEGRKSNRICFARREHCRCSALQVPRIHA